jgi:YggT family protein
MLHQIITLLLQVVIGLVAGLSACCACTCSTSGSPVSTRSGNPLGPLIFALTDWLVLPLRRLLPAVGTLGHGQPGCGLLIELAAVSPCCGCWQARARSPAFWCCSRPCSGWRTGAVRLSVLVIVYAVLSWVQTHSPMMGLLGGWWRRCCSRSAGFVPLVGGIDLSPLVLLVLAAGRRHRAGVVTRQRIAA